MNFETGIMVRRWCTLSQSSPSINTAKLTEHSSFIFVETMIGDDVGNIWFHSTESS